MYKGKRDAYIRIRVPQRLCDLVELSSGVWVEIKIPGDTLKPESWYSWMVKPEQVYWDRTAPNEYNIIDNLNDNANILIIKKIIRDGKRIVVNDSRQTMTPTELKKLYENE